MNPFPYLWENTYYYNLQIFGDLKSGGLFLKYKNSLIWKYI